MKKGFFFLLLLPFISFSQSKTILGTIKDFTTSLPIESVSISVENSNIGTISNEDGKFRLSLSEGSLVLKFNHLNYKSDTYILKKNENEIEIFLEPKAYTLDEVIIRKEPINKTLSAVVKNSKDKLEKSLLLNTYYREFIKVDDRYTNFSDGMLDYYIKRQSGASDLYVNQSRAYKLNDATTVERQKTAEAIYFYDVRDAISDAYNFKKLKHILESKYYDYDVVTKTDTQENKIEVVTITPKSEIEVGLYCGTVTYDVKSKLILEIDIKKSPEHKQFIPEVNALFFHFKVNEECRKASFKIDGDKYVLVYNQNKINIYIKMNDRIDNTYEFLSDLVTIDYKEGEFDLDRSRRYKQKSLFASGNNFKEEYWKTKNIILLSDDEEKLISELK